MSSRLILKNTNELCMGENGKQIEFYIPSYQRGYRWTQQVKKLLNDLLEFYNSSPTGGDIYCLQPIIVKRIDTFGTKYETIDGQQRLTTILLILNFLFRDDEKRFAVSYERGEANNIDKHYIDLAKKCIEDWFIENQKKDPKIRLKSEIERILTGYVTLIWYELPSEVTQDECRRIFRNINAGKIPLTISEITKAMLLNEKLFSNSRGEQLYRASVWDKMVHTFEDNAFWEFISEDDRNSQTRADYSLVLEWCVMHNTYKPPEQNAEIFNYFEDLLIGDFKYSEVEAEKLFNTLREYFRIFQDWYSVPEYCNFIGYLVRYKEEGLKKLIEIINCYKTVSHSEFLDWLKQKIRETVVTKNIEELSFIDPSEKRKIQDILVLFSIVTSNKLGMRFNFRPIGGWSLEHIFAQRSEIIKSEDRISWLKKYLDSNIIEIASRQSDESEYRANLTLLKNEISEYIKGNYFSDDSFKNLFSKIGELIEHYNISNVHSISNLALLGKDDNSSLNNAPFYEKRSRIIKMASLGKLSIPQSTLNVFQKTYSTTNVDSVYRGNLDIWSKHDSDAYLKNIKIDLKEFLEETVENE